MPNTFDTWTRTLIWQALETRTGITSPAQTILGAMMPDVERVLSSGGTAPKDFTLHDAGHAYRVAEWMTRLMPDNLLTQLSANELALLLLAAYLHDIGMTPEWGRVESHKNYLITGATDGFHGDELEAFQLWLAEREGINFTPPVRSLPELEELLTYYCRSRHSDWSAEWINAEFSNLRSQLYPGWIDDLILICKSHDQGVESILGPRFDPRDLGREGVVHKRYLAMVLRVADVLENDPERTPNVILRHRSITASSELYWQRDHIMHESLLQDHRVVISAEPGSALLYKAVEDSIDQIEAELELCNRIARERPLSVHPATGQAILPHRWVIEPHVVRKIQESPGRYEYIPGAFRPNTRKVLELLGGRNLYRSEMAAVRELLENAFDSINEQIARVQLKRKRIDDAYRSLLSREHSVQLQLSESDKGYKLTCRDTGVGMSKATIKDRLLVSGQSSSPELVALQIECRKKGLRLDRTGQFGVGVLSYFMLADHVVFRTRPSQELDAQDARGWEFETWGIGSFGELRPVDGLVAGTEVVLDLRPSFVKFACGPKGTSGKALFEALSNFVKKALLWCPCAVELSSPVESCPPVRFGPGWTEDADTLTAELVQVAPGLPGLGDPAEPSLSEEEVQDRNRTAELAAITQEMLPNVLRWHGPYEGPLPNGLGVYRIVLPYFELPGGASLAYLFRQQPSLTEGDLSRISTYDGVYPEGQIRWANSGFAVALQLPKPPVLTGSCRVTLNITDSVQLSLDVNRLSARLTPLDPAPDVGEFVESLARKVEAEFVEQHRNSVYASLNARALDQPVGTTPNWAIFRGDSLRWERFSLPAVLVLRGKRGPALADALETLKVDGWHLITWRQQVVSPCSQIRLWRGRGRSLDLFPLNSPPDYIVQGAGERPSPQLLWTDAVSAKPRAAWGVASFPPEWPEFIGAALQLEGRHLFVFNGGHQCGRIAGNCPKPWTEAVLKKGLYDIQRQDVYPTEEARRAIRTNPALALDWLVACLYSFKADEVWKTLRERDPGFIERVWETLGLDAKAKVTIALAPEVSYLDSRSATVDKVSWFGPWSDRPVGSEWKLALIPGTPNADPNGSA